MKQKIRDFFNKLINSITDLIMKVIEFPFFISHKIVDFIYNSITNTLNAVSAKLTTFRGVVIFIALIVFVAKARVIVDFVLAKVSEFITAIANALQLGNGVILGGALVIIAFLIFFKKVR